MALVVCFLVLFFAPFIVLVREKSKDIVALLLDENLLAEARRNRNPPVNRRPSPARPLTMDSKGSRPQIKDSTGSSLPGNLGSARRSFDELQNMDEETALKRALEMSMTDAQPNAAQRDLLQEK